MVKDLLLLFSQRRNIVLLFFGTLLLCGAFWYAYREYRVSGSVHPEVQELSRVSWPLDAYSAYFKKLADAKGAPYAFDVLRQITLPPTVDLHLLAHVVGDVLYKQQGARGIALCTEEFHNACSHSIVIGLFIDKGESALSEIAQACHDAPGGSGAYTICFHGLGHGILAFTGYNMEKAIAMCQKTGTPAHHNREYIECVGGVTMEMISGVHDPVTWKKMSPQYLKPGVPLSPCTLDFMPHDVRPQCLAHLTPRLFEAAGMSVDKPDPAYFKKSFSFCEVLPADDMTDREGCYGGFGKEFIWIAQGTHDIKDFGLTLVPALQKVREWCALAGNAAGESACNSIALADLFWGGESTPDASFAFCTLAPEQEQRECYLQLVDHVGYYLSGTSRGRELCKRFPNEYQEACRQRVL